MDTHLRIGVIGAGAIGCFVGGGLAACGETVVLVGRQRTKIELDQHGLTVSGLFGERPRRVESERLHVATSAAALSDCDVVLCCVKSAHSAAAAAELAPVLRAQTVVVSLQNGVRNADVLRAALPNQVVLGGIVGFNVVEKQPGSFRQATTGPLVIEAPAPPDARVTELARRLEAAELDVKLARDIRPLQWSKLVMNLNNAVSALTDQPTKELLFGEGYRRSLAAIMAEALLVLRRTHTPTARLGPLPARLFPFVLRLPTPLLRLVASAQLKVDAEARSSMWEDVSRGRATEVDYLNGEIVSLARAHGLGAPLNERVVALIHDVERRAAGSPKLSAAELWAALTG